MPLPHGAQAQLFLNDKLVGEVIVHGGDYSWSYGDFQPHPAFAEFAPLFGQWSLLMHFDSDDEPLSEAASEELRSAEMAIDGLRARLYVPTQHAWHELSQLNIDGPLIEWKES